MQSYIKRILIFVIFFTNISFSTQVNILYTANINATYQNCNCGSNPLGGIDRIKTYFDDFRTKNPNTLVIDGGNFFNSYSFWELNKKAYESLLILNYDLISPGIHIFFESKAFYNQYYKKLSKILINSNSNLVLNKSQDFKINDINIRIFNYISSELFKYSIKPNWINLKDELENIEYISNGINIIIFCGYLEKAQEFLKKYNKFDILFLSADQREGTWKSGKSIIVGGGHDAESVALVEINKNITTAMKVKYAKMDGSIVSDKSILKLFNNFEIIKDNVEKDY
jgi:hypothetical protein